MPAHAPLITTRFDAASTADGVVAGVDLTSVRAIVTGASSGIGLETGGVATGLSLRWSG